MHPKTMRPVAGRWLTADRAEVIVWGRPPTGWRRWQAVAIDGRLLEFFDHDGAELQGRTQPLLVRLDASTEAPRWWPQHPRVLR